MVYAMNLGLALADASRARVAMSHMRYRAAPDRDRGGRSLVRNAGFRPSYVGTAGVGATFEAGDAFPFGGALVVGYGPRTEEQALKHLAADSTSG